MEAALSYPLGMSEPKKGMGRPKGVRYPERLLVYAAKEDLENLQTLADEWDLSQAGAMRKLIREAAKARGLTPSPAPEDEPKA
jgi:hypothetical protein